MRRSSMSYHFSKYNIFFALFILILFLIGTYFIIDKIVENEVGKRALHIAEIVAEHPAIIEGLKQEHTTEALQQLALQIQKQVDAEYVVLGDENEIRYAHPIKERIGQKMVGDDNAKALIDGESARI